MMRRALASSFLVVLAACSTADVEPVTSSPPTTSSPSTSSTSVEDPGTSSTSQPTGSSTTNPPTTTTNTRSPLTGLAYEKVAEGLSFPVFVDAPSGDDRLFVVSKDGTIHIVKDGNRLVEPFLDVRELVHNDGEQGMLGLAFHPDYSTNGLLYIHYSDRHGDTKVVEYRVSDNPDLADPETARLVFFTTQPAGNHNGGMLAFGPDGYLYIALGDGGGANDRYGNGQRPDTVLGTLLRLDVDRVDPGLAYGIPPDNPFIDGGGAAEVWAYGLRNPWRFSFDSELLYIGDVGQNRWEEIHVASVADSGLNYGWPVMEGTNCFNSECSSDGLVLPVAEFSHGDGCSVTGGYVYRGEAIPEIQGRYFYSDYCTGFLRSFVYQGGGAGDPQDHTDEVGALGGLSSFGTDGFGELYVTTADGEVWKLVANRS